MQLLIYKYASYPCGTREGRPQSNGQWGVELLKREDERRMGRQPEGVIIGLNKRDKRKLCHLAGLLAVSKCQRSKAWKAFGGDLFCECHSEMSVTLPWLLARW